MNKTQQQVLESFTRVSAFLDANPMTGLIDVAPARAMLDDALRRVRRHVATQESAPAMGRAALHRQQDLAGRIKDDFMRPLVTIARAQTEPGLDAGLSAAFRMPTGRLGVQGLLQWCDGIREAARPVEALFVQHGMPADFLTRMAEAREELVRSMTIRATLTTAHVAARTGLQVELRRARLAVDRLDALVRACFRGDEAVLATWRSTKRVHKLTGGAATPAQRRQAEASDAHAGPVDAASERGAYAVRGDTAMRGVPAHLTILDDEDLRRLVPHPEVRLDRVRQRALGEHVHEFKRHAVLDGHPAEDVIAPAA
jgi:hypothetical protein